MTSTHILLAILLHDHGQLPGVLGNTRAPMCPVTNQGSTASTEGESRHGGAKEVSAALGKGAWCQPQPSFCPPFQRAQLLRASSR